MELQFYIKEDIKECWKVKALKRQINSSLFQRLALSTDKEGVLAPANEGYEVLTPANIIHAPYVLEFVEIPQQKRYKETELEKALKINMEQFLSELGRCLYWRRKCSVDRSSIKHELAPISFKQAFTESSQEEQLPHGVALLFPNGLRAHFGSGSEDLLKEIFTQSLRNGHV